MPLHPPRRLVEVTYEAYAQDYLRSLPPEHFMESIGQATQRAITVASLALVAARRQDFHVFSELLVQYPRPGERKPGQVVPDNMVVLSTEPIQARSSFNLPLEAAAPFWMLEYVSKNTKRKDYFDNFDKYERELKVPYYLTYYPDDQELTLYRHTGEKYVSVKPNGAGRLGLPEVGLEVALQGEWVRFWYEGELLPLPAELQSALAAEKRRAAAAVQRAEQAEHRADALACLAESEKHRAEEEKHRADALARRLEELERRLAAPPLPPADPSPGSAHGA